MSALSFPWFDAQPPRPRSQYSLLGQTSVAQFGPQAHAEAIDKIANRLVLTLTTFCPTTTKTECSGTGGNRVDRPHVSNASRAPGHPTSSAQRFAGEYEKIEINPDAHACSAAISSRSDRTACLSRFGPHSGHDVALDSHHIYPDPDPNLYPANQTRCGLSNLFASHPAYERMAGAHPSPSWSPPPVQGHTCAAEILDPRFIPLRLCAPLE